MNGVAVRCSNCDELLATIYPLRKGDFEARYYANCPFCQDKSYPLALKGKVAIDETDKTAILECIDKGNSLFFIMLERK
jgi:hypothetical protein